MPLILQVIAISREIKRLSDVQLVSLVLEL